MTEYSDQHRQGQRIDAQPVFPRATDTEWDRAVEIRNMIAAEVKSVLAAEQVAALTMSSANGIYPAWFRLEAWLPGEVPGVDARQRNDLVFVVDSQPYRVNPIVTTVTLTSGQKSYAYESYAPLSSASIADWTRFAIGRGSRPATASRWRNTLRQMFGLHKNRIRSSFRGGFSAATVLAFAGVASLILGPNLGVSVAPFMSLLGILLFVMAVLVGKRQRSIVHVPHQPVVPPRDTGLVDSWHAVVAEIGRDYPAVRRRLVTNIARACESVGVACRAETYSFRSPTGYEERERLIVDKGQSIVHIHIYPFGDDIFVGWDALLNWAKWQETAPVSTRAMSDMKVEFRELRPGLYIPSQFDIMDLNSLSALVHRCIKSDLLAILKERSISQEIDFRVIRGDRGSALDQKKRGGAAADSGQKRAWGPAPAPASGS